jgi:thiamine-monophosphate kinase
MKRARAHGRFRQKAIGSVLEPKPRQAFGRLAAKFFSSSIDSSDGLAASLYELAAQSRVDIEVDYDLVKAQGVEEFAGANGLDPRELVFHGGEEYEIVATVPQASLQRARAAAKRAGLDFIAIGRVKKGAGRVFAGSSLLENRGYLHFR